jgi:hypothetical protein
LNPSLEEAHTFLPINYSTACSLPTPLRFFSGHVSFISIYHCEFLPSYHESFPLSLYRELPRYFSSRNPTVFFSLSGTSPFSLANAQHSLTHVTAAFYLPDPPAFSLSCTLAFSLQHTPAFFILRTLTLYNKNSSFRSTILSAVFLSFFHCGSL